ncbi:MAG: AAA family ATPase [Coriobacteriia bacterium]
MRLRRIEAVRFGALEGRTLGDLGDRLTIVHGPNEAGKTSFSSLVRSVLYGFPTASKDDAYVSGAGKREGRLVFEDGAGSWAIERTEGPHGGPWSARALAGPERPRLRDEITAGVSEEAFRVVLGFGLDDMARIEALRGSGDDIIAPLYAASVGMRISPQAVREAIAAEADALFAPRARTKRVHELLGNLREVRSGLRDVRAAGGQFAAERRRLAELEDAREAARTDRDARRTRHAELASALRELDTLLEHVKAQESALLEMRRERVSAAAVLDAGRIDAAALDIAHEVDALAEEASAFMQSLEQMRETRAIVAQAERRFKEACEGISGWSPEQIRMAVTGPTVSAFIEEARNDLAGLEADLASRKREADRADAEARRLATVAETVLKPLDLGPGSDQTDLEYLAAQLDSIDDRRDREGEQARRADGPAWVLIAAGLLTAVGGLVLREYLSAAIGAVLVVAGGVFLWRARRVGTGRAASAAGSDVYRQRRALETARAALATADEAKATAARALEEVRLSADTISTRRALFSELLVASGFPGDLEPLAAAQLYAAIVEARRLDAEATTRRDEAERQAERLAAFVARTQAASRCLWERETDVGLDEVAALVGRLKEAVATSRVAHSGRERLTAQLADLDARIGLAEKETETASVKSREMLAHYELDDGGSRAEFEALEAQASAALTEAEGRFEELTQEASALQGALSTLASEDQASQLRLEEAGLRERLDDAVDQYATRSVAARLLALAQERYERERQPDVVKRAEEVFRRVTSDRYTALAVPLGEGRVEVLDDRAAAKTSAHLSKGTAEALYLALRLGLVWHLGSVGQGLPMLIDDVLANFDPERLRGAATAIVDLATERQVVFFTCHERTAALLGELAPDAVRLDLDRC